jgi:TRAP-type mannitol/chloroaromatic compound transport system permease small subunit
MKIIKLMNFIDKISEWTGVVISWLVIPLTAVVFYEVLLRYVFNNPTDWVYDTAWMLYSTLFLIGGAYTLLHQSIFNRRSIYSSSSKTCKNRYSI